MAVLQDTRDRVIRLEEKVDHIEERQEVMGRKVDEMHEVLTKARGVHWLMIAVVGAAGFLVSKAGALLHLVRP